MRLKARETDHVTRLMTRPLFEYDADADEDDVDEEETEALDAELAAILATSPSAPAAAEPARAFPTVPATVPKTTRELERELGL